jgi:hypothetical protein
VDNIVLQTAVMEGHLGCVALLVAHGLPHEPFIIPVEYRDPMGPEQARCLQYLAHKGCPIHPDTLIWAAQSGDVDTVRFLHSRGVRLWHAAYEDLLQTWRIDAIYSGRSQALGKLTRRNLGVLALPSTPGEGDHMWGTLMYGWVMGAPVTPVMSKALMSMRNAALFRCRQPVESRGGNSF